MLDELSQFSGDFFGFVGQKEKQVDVAARVQGAAAITSGGDQGDGIVVPIGRRGDETFLTGGFEEVVEDEIDELGTLAGDLQPAPARLVGKFDPVVLDLDETLVKFQQLGFGVGLFSQRHQFLRGVGADFAQMGLAIG